MKIQLPCCWITTPIHWGSKVGSKTLAIGAGSPSGGLIRAAVSGISSSSSGNANEAIKYALLDRSADGREGDSYALLKKRGRRYTIVP